MESIQYGIISFSSSHQAIAAELAVADLPGSRLIPMPPEISAGCGLVLRIAYSHVPRAVAILNSHHIAYQDVYSLVIQNATRNIRKLYDLF